MADGLNARELTFCSEYVIHGHKAKAAIAAGYPEKSAHVTASKLLKKAKIQAEIARLRAPAMEKCGVTLERVIAEMAKLAFYDPRNLFESDSSPKQVKDLDDETAAAIAGVEIVELFEPGRGKDPETGEKEDKHCYGLVKKIKLADKGQNLERLRNHLAPPKPKTLKVGGEDGGPVTFRFLRIGSGKVAGK